MKKKSFFSILTVMLISIATVSFYGCDKDNGTDGGGDNPPAGKTDPSTIAAANLVVYMPFESEDKILEKGSGITFTKVAYEEGGTAPTFPAGRRGNCYQGANGGFAEFDLAASNPFINMDEFTIATWVKSAPVGASAMLSLNGGDANMGGLDLIVENGSNADSLNIKGYLYSDSGEWKGQDIVLHKPPFATNRWFHLVYSYNKATSAMSLWANGVFVGESVRYSGPDPDGEDGAQEQPLLGALKLVNMTKFYIGAWAKQVETAAPDDWMSYYAGMLDEMRIYNKALSEVEIKDLYDAEVENID